MDLLSREDLLRLSVAVLRQAVADYTDHNPKLRLEVRRWVKLCSQKPGGFGWWCGLANIWPGMIAPGGVLKSARPRTAGVHGRALVRYELTCSVCNLPYFSSVKTTKRCARCRTRDYHRQRHLRKKQLRDGAIL